MTTTSSRFLRRLIFIFPLPCELTSNVIKVLVRATGRVVSADQCGVSLDKRFAFYVSFLPVSCQSYSNLDRTQDQIHTTGMDIKHVVNATAVITLGKDMVFR